MRHGIGRRLIDEMVGSYAVPTEPGLGVGVGAAVGVSPLPYPSGGAAVESDDQATAPVGTVSAGAVPHRL